MQNYNSIKAALQKKGYILDERQEFVNFVAVRESDAITNRFTDSFYILIHGKFGATQSPINLCERINWTTKPGLKGSILEPVTVEGITGTAVIQPGQYINAFKFEDTNKGFSSYPFFRQVKGLNYWRDYDKDIEVDHVQAQLNKIFGTHLHRMSQTGTFGSGNINNWSLGCNGAPEPEFKKLLPYARNYVKLYGYYFHYTILEAKDLC